MRLAPQVLLAAIVLPVALTAQLKTPTDWKWRQDAPAPLAPGSKMEPGSWVFVQMPPGWHVTTGSPTFAEAISDAYSFRPTARVEDCSATAAC